MNEQVQLMIRHLQASGLAREDLIGLAQAIIEVLKDPQRYPELIESAVRNGLIQPGDAPEQFNQQFLMTLLVALKEVVQAAEQPPQSAPEGFACGGLASLARQGRGGDTMLAHINPREAEVLRRMGGSDTVNPNTGLREFKGGDPFQDLGKGIEDVGKVLVGGDDVARMLGQANKDLGVGDLAKAAAPIALAYFGGPLLAGALGGGLLGTVGSGALMGGLSSAATGGDWKQGMLRGGLGGGLGALGSFAGDALNGAVGSELLGEAGKQYLGSALGGAASSALSGGDWRQGAVTGLTGRMAGNAVQGLGGSLGGPLGRVVGAGAQNFGNVLSAGGDLKSALASGLMTGGLSEMQRAQLATQRQGSDGGAGMSRNIGQHQGVGEDTAAIAGDDSMALTGGTEDMTRNIGQHQGIGETSDSLTYGGEELGGTQTAATPSLFDKAASMGGGALKTAGLLAMLGGIGEAKTPEDVKRGVQTMSPEQQAYFNRASTRWDWNKLQQDARAKNMNLGQYMSSSWNDISRGAYNTPDSGQPVALAQGGALTRLARGGGSGRDDTIEARLSDGEFVFDAETVALLGDGSTTEGARRLDQMREKIRQQKGKALAKGKISPNAKSPLAYLQGAA